MDVALALVRIIDTNPLRVSYRSISCLFTVTVVKSSCTRVTRQSASVIRVGVAYVNVRLPGHDAFKRRARLGYIDKRLRLIINKMLFKPVIPLRI